MYFKLNCDYEKSESAGAGGMFQIASLEDANGNDVTDKIDQGKHYSSLAEVKEDLALKFNVPLGDVDIEEV